MSRPLLQVQNLYKVFPIRQGWFRPMAEVKAVQDVSLEIEAGKTFALVGESGCGKTTLSRMILGLELPTRGDIVFDGINLVEASRTEMRKFRHEVQAVFQDPYASLSPRQKVGAIVTEPLRTHEQLTKGELKSRIDQLLDVVGLPPRSADAYPHEFSGGQRQRIAIARAISLNPRLIVLDEPTSALDVSIRAQILNLLSDIQEEYSLTYLIIAHDLALVEHFSTEVGVMYLGSIVESGPTEEVYSRPAHPYTEALLAAVPRPDPAYKVTTGFIKGEPASAMSPPAGCTFHPRCPRAMAHCHHVVPQKTDISSKHWTACHLRNHD
jgi:oligopeptide/dipeptide ABC transporter ATP-binding protein